MKKFNFSAPVYSAVEKYAASRSVSFHTPGHMGKKILGICFSDVYTFDATELSVTDELYAPRGCILEAEKKASELFGTYHTFLSAGGASQCVKAALADYAGKKVIFDRNIHSSVAAAICFYGIDAVFVYGGCDTTGAPVPPCAEAFGRAIAENPDAAAVFATTPTYFGLSADCAALKTLAGKYGVDFIADNAHGTHYRFCLQMKNTRFDAHLADISVDSAHKTLPVMTGGAFLHYYKRTDENRVRRFLMDAGSTSPSFPILASLDAGRALCAEKGESLYTETAEKVSLLKRKLAEKGYTVNGGENYDPLRLTVYFGERSADVAAKLEKSGIFAEMNSCGQLVFIITPFCGRNDMNILFRELLRFPSAEPPLTDICFNIPERACGRREAMLRESETVEVYKSVGRISAVTVNIHEPPCVPPLLPGEIISKGLARRLPALGYKTIEVLR